VQQIGNLLLELAFLDESPIHPPNGVYLHRLSGHEDHPVCLDALVLTLSQDSLVVTVLVDQHPAKSESNWPCL
jgi:hypothetical protein